MACERDVNLKLALEVEKHPCLYNFELPDYTRKDLIDKAWGEVGKKTNLTMSDCKERWKNIRSAFVRSLKPLPTGSNKTKKPYYLHNYLQFIVPFVKARSTIENSGYIEYEHPDESGSPLLVEMATEEEISEDNVSIKKEHQIPKSSKPYPLKRKFIEEEDPFSEHNLEQKKESDEQIANRYFLLSILPELNSMNDQQIRQFKIKVLLLIEEILTGSCHNQ